MNPAPYRFDRFELDPEDRRLTRDGEVVALNGRYLDVLVLLVREGGRLVSRERLLDEVWRGVPVTDEALSQAIRTLRRELGDEAARPRLIETAPRHGYRFIAPVTRGEASAEAPRAVAALPAPDGLARPLAGALGGGAAGALGGLAYGLAMASPGAGALSTVLVMTVLTLSLGALGGGAIGAGVALSRRLPGPEGRRRLIGAAAGGALLGGVVELLGLDAFHLLLGGGPTDITGAGEGALLGAAVGLGLALGRRAAAGLGALAGLAVALLGGRLLGGSLAALAEAFPGARLSLAPLGRMLGDEGFGTVARAVTGAAEGALFVAAVTAALLWAARRS
ncbi:MAG TPA: transcriptional regulator [Brevundimonas sp.]|jgi:DNA-binding winged helix-turn-helix (wHTH) protein|uniref:winged helix-turn-helix domain-containing protein n=1 Tax=Brevundimonas sp. TaxID=1871086 RepID=UPI002E141BA5|nr:transcriptional regulator [Brevundimonas sp.]